MPRPRIKIPRTRFDLAMEIIGAGIFVWLAVMLVMMWPAIPDRVPQHMDFAGNVDKWGGKNSLLELPIVGAVIYIGLSLLMRVPHIFNYTVPITDENAARQYRLALSLLRWMKVELAISFTFIEWTFLAIALGGNSGNATWQLVGILSVLFVTLGAHIVAMRKAG